MDTFIFGQEWFCDERWKLNLPAYFSIKDNKYLRKYLRGKKRKIPMAPYSKLKKDYNWQLLKHGWIEYFTLVVSLRSHCDNLLYRSLRTPSTIEKCYLKSQISNPLQRFVEIVVFAIYSSAAGLHQSHSWKVKVCLPCKVCWWVGGTHLRKLVSCCHSDARIHSHFKL